MLFRIKTSVSITVLILFSIAVFNALGYAQASTPQKGNQYLWINGGIGVGSLGVGAGASLSLQIGQVIFSPRIAGTIPSMDDAVSDIGLTVGYSSKKPGSTRYFSIAGGLGYVDYTDDPTIGPAIDIQLFSTPFSFAGIGLQGFANINSQKSFFGLILCLQLGKLR